MAIPMFLALWSMTSITLKTYRMRPVTAGAFFKQLNLINLAPVVTEEKNMRGSIGPSAMLL